MELNTTELEAVETAVKQNGDSAVHELDALQLALIGGGCGEVVF